MILNENDKKMFESLKESGQGKWLAEYCERLQVFMCDCRNWQADTDKEAMKLASEKIEEGLISHLKNVNKKSNKIDFR